ncbi:unnamed protein product, partial [marine sediment metagenome]
MINDDASCTNSLNVNLALSATNAFQMAISNTSDFSGVSWENYNTSKDWVLIEGDGEKVVYAKFRSSAGGVSEVVSESIIFDATPPDNVTNFKAAPGDRAI